MMRSLVRAAMAAGLLAMVPLPGAAQSASAAPSPAEQAPPAEAAGKGRKAGTYFKVGLAHWQGDIFSPSSLTTWRVDLFGAKYNLTSAGFEIDTYFPRGLLVSGFAVGYRKDALRYTESGHMFNATLFRDLDLAVAALKVGGGMEWGPPSLNFDSTEFDYPGAGGMRYRHTYPARNGSLPVGGPLGSASLYPFAQVSVVQRPSAFLLEAGMRLNFVRFHFDDYDVSPAGDLTTAFSQRRMRLPYLFVNVGLKMF